MKKSGQARGKDVLVHAGLNRGASPDSGRPSQETPAFSLFNPKIARPLIGPLEIEPPSLKWQKEFAEECQHFTDAFLNWHWDYAKKMREIVRAEFKRRGARIERQRPEASRRKGGAR